MLHMTRERRAHVYCGGGGATRKTWIEEEKRGGKMRIELFTRFVSRLLGRTDGRMCTCSQTMHLSTYDEEAMMKGWRLVEAICHEARLAIIVV